MHKLEQRCACVRPSSKVDTAMAYQKRLPTASCDTPRSQQCKTSMTTHAKVNAGDENRGDRGTPLRFWDAKKASGLQRFFRHADFLEKSVNGSVDLLALQRQQMDSLDQLGNPNNSLYHDQSPRHSKSNPRKGMMGWSRARLALALSVALKGVLSCLHVGFAPTHRHRMGHTKIIIIASNAQRPWHPHLQQNSLAIHVNKKRSANDLPSTFQENTWALPFFE